MNQNDLCLKYAEIIKMCKGTALESKPWVCVKYDGEVMFRHPAFDVTPKYYEFAIAILEDKPVFVGDSLYHPSGAKWIVGDTDDLTGMSWQPPKPKRTFMLNGVELPCPLDWQESSNGDVAVIDGQVFWFKNKIDADLVRDTLSKIFREARDKP